jgi:tetratricopeptide (TPR) repeat protein
LLRESSAKLPNEAEVMFHWGMVQYAMGAEAEARTALQVALDTSEAFDGRAEAVRRMSILDLDPRNADDKVRGSLEAALREDPKDAVALMRLAESRTLAGAENEAVTLLQRALDIYPGNMRALTELERLHLQSPTGVREVYDRARKAVELAPYDPDVAHIAGRTAFLAGEYHAAARYLREAAQRRENDPGLWFDLARAIYSIGRVDEAAAAMERVTSMEAPDALQESAAEFLSMIAVARSRIANATTEARIATALAQNPADVPTLVAAAELKLARSDTDGAIRHFEEVLGQYPDFAPAQKALARLYASDPNMVARAGELARKARETMPGDPELTGILGIIAYHERNYGQAAQLLQESTAAGGSGANLEFFLGMAFWAEGNHKAGRRHLEQAIELGLPPEQAAEARRMLTQLTD